MTRTPRGLADRASEPYLAILRLLIVKLRRLIVADQVEPRGVEPRNRLCKRQCQPIGGPVLARGRRNGFLSSQPSSSRLSEARL